MVCGSNRLTKHILYTLHIRNYIATNICCISLLETWSMVMMKEVVRRGIYRCEEAQNEEVSCVYIAELCHSC